MYLHPERIGMLLKTSLNVPGFTIQLYAVFSLWENKVSCVELHHKLSTILPTATSYLIFPIWESPLKSLWWDNCKSMAICPSAQTWIQHRGFTVRFYIWSLLPAFNIIYIIWAWTFWFHLFEPLHISGTTVYQISCLWLFQTSIKELACVPRASSLGIFPVL